MDYTNDMRIWTLHPKYLDPQGLVALWRETLLAQAVLCGETRGYQSHPQLQRFKQNESPLSAISNYLLEVHAEASRRGYSFNLTKIKPASDATQIAATTGQVEYEWQHLMSKLQARSPALHEKWARTAQPDLHPIFNSIAGPIEPWERLTP